MYSSSFQIVGTVTKTYENCVVIETSIENDAVKKISGYAVSCQNPKEFDDYVGQDIRIFVDVLSSAVQFIEGSRIEKVVPATNEDDQFENTY